MSDASVESADRAPRTLVIGAGLAGLVTALELVEAGHDVHVFEARPYPGGRVHTLRAPFDDGLYAEEGAARIPDCHTLTLAYVERFGLALEPFQTSPPTLFVRGRCFDGAEEDAAALAFGCSPADGRGAPRQLADRLQAIARAELGDPTDPHWPPPSLERYDALSGAELLRELGASPLAIEWFDLGGGTIGVEASALSILRELVLNHPARRLKIVGGNDRLPHALAARLGRRVRFESTVRRIEHDDSGVRIVVEHAGRHDSVRGDRLVCTVPFPVLRQIEVAPPLSPGKMRAIAQLDSNAVSRAYLQTRSRFWNDEGRSGFAITDHPMDVFDATLGQPGTRGILMTYTRDTLARRLADLDDAEHLRFALNELERIFPGMDRHFERGVTKCWTTDPWSRGAVADFRPGQMVTLIPHIASAEGPIHFAGEHTSPWAGWMQGAIESGERAAREVRLS